MGLSDSVLPHHAVRVPDDPRPVARLRGRPRKVRLQPRADARIYAQTINAMRTTAIGADPLVCGLVGGDDTASVIAKVKVELARESASLGWEAQHAAEAGRDPSNFSARRIDALTKLAAITGTALRLGVRRELDRDILSRLQAFFVSTVETVARATTPGKSDALVERLRERLAEKRDKTVEDPNPPLPK